MPLTWKLEGGGRGISITGQPGSYTKTLTQKTVALHGMPVCKHTDVLPSFLQYLAQGAGHQAGGQQEIDQVEIHEQQL